MDAPLAATAEVTGLPALLIVLLILFFLLSGLVAVVRFIGRKAKGE